MKTIFDTYRPEGFSTVTSYLFVKNPNELIHFLKNAFFAEEIHRSIHPNTNEISNCILKVGDTCFMIAQAREPFDNMRTAHYLFVDDVDRIYQKAIENGARDEFAPADMDYGDRQAGVVDPSGNYWWISKRLIEKGYEEK